MSGSGVSPVFAESGTLTASGSTRGFRFTKPFNITVSGTWAGSWVLEMSPDEGLTWTNCLLPDGTQNVFTTNGFVAVPNVWERGLRFRLTFTRTSGDLAWRFSQ